MSILIVFIIYFEVFQTVVFSTSILQTESELCDDPTFRIMRFMGLQPLRTVVQQTDEEETADMEEIPADRPQLAENRSFEDIFNEAGSFMADDEDVFMEEYERLEDQNAKEDSDSDPEVENSDISVVNHFKSIKFAQPIPKWP